MRIKLFLTVLFMMGTISGIARAVDQQTIDNMIFLLRQPEWNQWGDAPFDDLTLYDGLQAIYAQSVNSNDEILRKQAIWAMGETGLTAFVPTVVGAISDDPVVACFALGKLPSEYSVETLISMLDNKDPHVRDSAAWGLGNMPYHSGMLAAKAKAIEALNAHKSVEKESWVKATIAAAIDMIQSGIPTSAAFEEADR